MKTYIGSLCGFIGVLLTTSSFAMGVNVGNGGALVVGTCDGVNPSKNYMQVLDLYEANHLMNLQVDFGSVQMSESQIIDMILTRLAAKDPGRAKLYRDWVASFYDEIQFADPRIPFPDLVDAGDVVRKLPDGCKLLKIVDQVEPTPPVDLHRYLIRADYFNQLDSQNRAAIILHEVIYRDAISRGHETSKKARAFLSLLASSRFEQLNQQQYAQMLIELGMADHMLMFDKRILRLFDETNMKWAQAQTFCINLRGSSGIAQLRHYTPDELEIFKQSKMHQFIVGENGIGLRDFWAIQPNSNGVWDYWGPIAWTGSPHSDKPIMTLCEQEIATSPWTSKDP